MVFSIYCDGAVSKNGYDESVGGWGAILLDDTEQRIGTSAGYKYDTTNQRMELMACIKGLGLANNYFNPDTDEIIVYSDSAYLCNCFNNGWWKKWVNNGWKNSKNEPVANQDLWEQILKFYDILPVRFEKVKGHAGNKYNEEVDKIAVSMRMSAPKKPKDEVKG